MRRKVPLGQKTYFHRKRFPVLVATTGALGALHLEHELSPRPPWGHSSCRCALQAHARGTRPQEPRQEAPQGQPQGGAPHHPGRHGCVGSPQTRDVPASKDYTNDSDRTGGLHQAHTQTNMRQNVPGKLPLPSKLRTRRLSPAHPPTNPTGVIRRLTA